MEEAVRDREVAATEARKTKSRRVYDELISWARAFEYLVDVLPKFARRVCLSNARVLPVNTRAPADGDTELTIRNRVNFVA